MSHQDKITNTGDDNIILQHVEGSNVVINKITGVRHTVPKALTSLPRPALVLGREEVIEEIHAKFQHQSETLLVNGVGGIGKTTVALHYIDRYFDDYAHLAYVEVGESIRSALAAHANLRDNLGLRETFEKIAPEQYEQEASRIVLNMLNTLEGRTLLVLDNANNAEDLAEMRPRLAALRCRVLFTTRAKVDGAQIIEIEELPPDLALELFEEHCDVKEHERPTVEAILKEIHYHTLLIEHIAKVVQRNFKDMDTVLYLLKEGFVRHPDLNVRKIHTGQHAERQSGDLPREAAPVDYLRLLFREIGDLDEDCQTVLRLCSLLPSQDYTEAELLDFFLIPKEAESDFADVLDRLTHTGWLARKDARPPQWKLHALLQDVVKHELKPDGENCASLIKSLTDKLDIDQSKDNPVTKFPWLPYGEFAVGQLADREDAGVAELMDKIRWVLRQFGDYKKAAHYGEQALAFAEKKLGMEHQDTARYQSNLALIYKELGHYEEAANLQEVSLSVRLKIYDAGHSEIAISQSNLAIVYRYLGRYEEAAELLRAALDNALKNFGKDHPTVAIGQSNLALVYRNLGRYEEAAELLRAALDSDLKNLGKDHPNVARCQSNLALVYQALGRYEEAAELLRAALDSDLKNFGKDHPNVAIRQSNLATVYRDLGRYEEAAELFKASLQNFIHHLGENHPNVAVLQSNLANVYQALGRYEEAAELLRAALDSDLKNFGKDHPNVATDYNNLGWLYLDMNKPAEAKAYFEKALAILEQVLPAGHPNIAGARQGLEEATRRLSTP